MKFFDSIDLSELELKNFLVHNTPTSDVAKKNGRLVYSSSTLYYSDTSKWYTIAKVDDITSAINALDYTDTASGYVSKVDETDGKISVTHASFKKPTLTWAGGTSSGPTIKVNTDGGDSDTATIPSASDSASGIVTTGAQTFAGAKTFNGAMTVSNTLTVGSASANKATTLNGTLSVSGLATFSNGIKIAASKTIAFNGGNTDTTIGAVPTIEWDATNHAFKITGNLYATGFVSAGGISTTPGGGGGLDEDAMWEALGGSATNHVIDRTHIPNLPASQISDLADYAAFNSYYTKATIDDKLSKLLAEQDALVYRGVIAGGSTGNYGALTPAANKGDLYKVSTAGKIDGISVEVGDMLICNTDNTAAATSSNYTTIAAKWDVIQTNLTNYVTSLGGKSGAITLKGNNDKEGTINLSINSSNELSASIIGLGSAAYTASTAYATAAQGTKADNALAASSFTAANIVSTLGTTAVNRATADASGNTITSTYATKTQLTNGSVTKVGTSTVGGTTTPIYLNAGSPTACTMTGDADGGSTTIARRYQKKITGDGSTKTFTIQHSLGNRRVSVSVYDASYNMVMCDVLLYDTNNVKVTYAVAPTTSESYYVVIVG